MPINAYYDEISFTDQLAYLPSYDHIVKFTAPLARHTSLTSVFTAGIEPIYSAQDANTPKAYVTLGGKTYPISASSVVDVARSARDVNSSNPTAYVEARTAPDGGSIVSKAAPLKPDDVYKIQGLQSYTPLYTGSGSLYPLLFEASSTVKSPLFLYGGVTTVRDVTPDNSSGGYYGSSSTAVEADEEELEYAAYVRQPLTGVQVTPTMKKLVRVAGDNTVLESFTEADGVGAVLANAHTLGYEATAVCDAAYAESYKMYFGAGGSGATVSIPEGTSKFLVNGGGYKTTPFDVTAFPLVKHLRVRAITNPLLTSYATPLEVQVAFLSKVAGITSTGGVLDNEYEEQRVSTQYTLNTYSDPWCEAASHISTDPLRFALRPPAYGDFSAVSNAFTIPAAVVSNVSHYFTVDVDIPLTVADVSDVKALFVGVKGEGHWKSAVFVVELSIDGTEWFPLHWLDVAKFNADYEAESSSGSSYDSSYDPSYDSTDPSASTTESDTTAVPAYFKTHLKSVTEQRLPAPAMLAFREGAL